MENKLTLVTDNITDFERIEGIKIGSIENNTSAKSIAASGARYGISSNSI